MSVDTYTTPGSHTWTAPSSGTVAAECWGGGRGGARSDVRGGAGGPGGGYSIKTISVTAGNYDLEVGAGGAGATAVGLGTAGGDSWFSTTGTVIADGGGSATTLGADGDGSDTPLALPAGKRRLAIVMGTLYWMQHAVMSHSDAS